MSSALAGLLNRVEPKTPLASVQRVWASVVGDALAPHATPTAMSAGGVITVSCEASVWAQEIDLLAYELITRLNVELGAGTVRELRAHATEPAGWTRSRRRPPDQQ